MFRYNKTPTRKNLKKNKRGGTTRPDSPEMHIQLPGRTKKCKNRQKRYIDINGTRKCIKKPVSRQIPSDMYEIIPSEYLLNGIIQNPFKTDNSYLVCDEDTEMYYDGHSYELWREDTREGTVYGVNHPLVGEFAKKGLAVVIDAGILVMLGASMFRLRPYREQMNQGEVEDYLIGNM